MSEASIEVNLASSQLIGTQMTQEISEEPAMTVVQIQSQEDGDKNDVELSANRQIIITRLNQRGTQQKISQFVSLTTPFQYSLPVYYKPRPIQTHSHNQQNSPQINKETAKTEKSTLWQQFAKQAYDYYCKSTYHTGKTPTFESIQSNANKMTVSSFVRFCRDFQVKLDLITLMNIFKKATNFGSSMTYQQFVEGLFIITETIFQKEPVPDTEENQFMQVTLKHEQRPIERRQERKKSEPPQDFQKFLKIICMDSLISFKNKKVLLDMKARKHGVNARQNLIQLSPTSKYKYEVKSLNGKNPQELKYQIQIRKKDKSLSKEKEKEQRQLNEKIKAHRYAEFNKIAISDKKIMKGGYMSPPKKPQNQECQTIISSGDSKTLNRSYLLETHMNPAQNIRPIERNQTQTMKQNCKKTNQRHHTQFNTYTNSLQSSIYLDSVEKNTLRDETSYILSTQQSRSSKPTGKTKGYLTRFREKDKKDRSSPTNKEKNSFEINSIIKGARNELEDHNFHTKKRKQINSNNTNQMNENKTILKVKLKTTPEEKQVYNLGLHEFLGDMKEDDEFLENLSLVKKQENPSQNKYVIREFIKF